MTEATAAPQDPIKLQVGEISFLNDKSVRIGHNDHLFINGCDVTGFKIGDRVNAKVIGNKLYSIEPKAEEPPETRSGHGIIKAIKTDPPALIYEYSWKDKTTQEPLSAQQVFYSFSEVAQAKLAQFKVGDKISVRFFGRGTTAICQDIGVDAPKFGSGGGWKGAPKDPAVEARKQVSIETQNARIISKDVIALCLQQYPIAADPDNYEKAVSLFPQLMQMVRQGEEILMGGKR